MLIKKEGLFDTTKFDIKDVLKKLPDILSFGNTKAKMNWKMDKDGNPVITSSLSIPLSNRRDDFTQLVTVLSLGLQKKLFSLKQRITQSIGNHQTLKEDFPLWENESFKSLQDLLDKIKDSLLNSTTNKVKDLLKKAGVKESLSLEAEERTDVIVNVGNKKECCRTEGFNTSITGHNFIKKIQSFLIKIFGPTIYFDHITDNSADLYFKGGKIAELMYDNQTEEVVIAPENRLLSPVEFYDTSIYEVQDYLSDLLLGDVDPQLA